MFDANDRCHWCGQQMTLKIHISGKMFPHTATIEHVIPKSKGGANRRDNIVLACAKCNNERGDGEPQQQC